MKHEAVSRDRGVPGSWALESALLLVAMVVVGCASPSSEALDGGSDAIPQAKATGVERVHWISIPLSDSSLTSLGNEIRALAASRSGALWIATDKGLSRLVRGELEAIPRQDGWDITEAFELAVTTGGIAAATRQGLFWFDDPAARLNGRRLYEGVVRSVVIQQDKLWFLSRLPSQETRLGYVTLDKNRKPTSEMQLVSSPTEIFRLLPGTQGRLLYQNEFEAWQWFDLRKLEPVPNAKLPPDIKSSAVTQNGLLVLTSEHLRQFTQEGDLISDEDVGDLMPLAPSKDGGTERELPLVLSNDGDQIWVGGQSQLLALDRATRAIKRTLLLPGVDSPVAVVEDSLHRIWVATSKALLVADPLVGWLPPLGSSDSTAPRALNLPSGGSSLDSRSGLARASSQASGAAGFTPDGGVWVGSLDRLMVFPPGGAAPIQWVVDGGLVLDAMVDKSVMVATPERILHLKEDGGVDMIAKAGAATDKELATLEHDDLLLEKLAAHPWALQRLESRLPPETTLKQMEARDTLLNFADEVLGKAVVRGMVRPTQLIGATGETLLAKCPTPSGGQGICAYHEDGGVQSFQPAMSGTEVRATTVDPVTEHVLTVTEQGDIVSIDHRAIVTSEKPSGAKVVSTIAPAPGARPLLVNEESEIWRRSQGNVWQKVGDMRPLEKAEATNAATISSLLAQPEGGVLVGCSRCAESKSFFDVVAEGMLRPVEFEGHWPLGSKQGILLDSRGTLWLATYNGLFTKEKSSSKFREVLGDEEGISPTVFSLLEFPQGRIWAASSSGLWRIDEGRRPSKVKGLPEEMIVALAPDGSSPNRLWVGGLNFLASLSAEPLPEASPVIHTDRLKDALKAVPPDSRFFVEGIASDGDALLVLTSYGFLRLATDPHGSAQLIPLGRNNLLPFTAGCQQMLQTRNGPGKGTVYVAIGYGSSCHGELWSRDSRRASFRPVPVADDRVTALAEGTGGDLLIGAGGQVFVLQQGKVRALATLPQAAQKSADSLRHPLVCSLSDEEVLVRTADGRAWKVKTGQDPEILRNVGLPEWNRCIALGDGKVLLQTDTVLGVVNLSGASPTVEEAEIKTNTPERIWDLVPKTLKGGKLDPNEIYLAAGDSLWRYGSAGFELWMKAPLAPEKEQSVHLSVDDGGVWFSVGKRVYRNDDDRGFRPISEQIELGCGPIQSNGVVARGPDEALIFTSAGPCRASFQKGRWQFKLLDPGGLVGQEVGPAILFELQESPVLAVGTDLGVSVARRQNGTWHWSFIGKVDGLDGLRVHALRWNPKHHELWMGTARGLFRVVLGPSQDGSAVAPIRGVDNITSAAGLPERKVTAISISPEGENVWFLMEGSLIRWIRPARVPSSEKARIIEGMPVPLSGVHAILGPAMGAEPPKLLVQDPASVWGILDPGSYLLPQLDVTPLFLALMGDVKFEAMSPTLEDRSKWRVRYGIDTSPQDRLPVFFPRDLFYDSGEHIMEAEIVPTKGDANGVYVVAAQVENLKEGERIIRLVFMALALAGLVVYGIIRVRQWRRNVSRLKARWIPYISGAAITAPTNFVGREMLLHRLRDTISTTNYALLGDFRIGKTSIQFQFAHLIEQVKSTEHVYLPVFIDLQHLGDREQEFFYFLGKHLMDLARSHSVPAAVLSETLHSRHEKTPERYDSISFSDDVALLCDHWVSTFAPRAPVVILQVDEVNLLEAFSDSTLSMFRAVLVSEQRLKAILTGKNIPMRSNATSPWWNIFTLVDVEPLTPDEARALIVNPVRGVFEFEEEAIQVVQARAQGRPLEIQRICTAALLHKYNNPRQSRRITLLDLRAALSTYTNTASLPGSQPTQQQLEKAN